ncbi:ATP-dependent metalloprotease FtsH [Candidatus Thiomargarita nelsonii]|uniref:ATP-dependent metalloprotease FtsH n=1 Tax=Candidatus Thiomargarita nelsonii TaxID=1003181 RepID=A0A176RU43_9GAMM|nr:ATP-dependent metalloprotease FtsH [Candidatus Thiomargarita nelsonii]
MLVFDEFDAIAAKRSGREDGGSRAGNAVVAQMLTEMDGFRPDVPMLVIGTTNRLELIDEALLRPSRFQPIAIGMPEIKARRAIAEVHARHFQVDKYISAGLLDVIAEATNGFNGDEIRSLFRDACVGFHCETPPREIDARRLGELVGNIRRNAEKRIIAASSQNVTHSITRDTQRPAPSGPMMSLTALSREE